MPAPQFYPAVSNLVSAPNLPAPVKAAFDKVSGKLFYKTYYVEKSIYGDSAYHHLVLIIKGKAGLPVLGGEDGLELLFNPGSTANTVEIPLALYYKLPILKYLRGVSLKELSSVEDYFGLILKMFGITEPALVFEALEVFLNGYDDPVAAFVQQFNENPNYSEHHPLQIGPTGNPYSDTIKLIDTFRDLGLDIKVYILENYIFSDDLNEAFERMSLLFNRWLGRFTVDTLIDLFVPKFSVTAQSLELALAFPRTWLKPVDAEGEVIDDDSKSVLSYNVGSLTFHSEKGFTFNNPNSFSLTPSQIGNTGLLLDINGLKLDLRDDQSIPEVDAYRYGPEFKGVYAEYATITLPKKWFGGEDSNSTARVAGYDLLIGTGGVTGRLALEAVDGSSSPRLVKTLGTKGFEVAFTSFDINFERNKIVSSDIVGQLKIPKLKDARGNDAVIDVQGHLDSEGDFVLTASGQDGFAPIEIPEVLKLYIQSIELGREEGEFFIGASAELEFINPVMNRLTCNEGSTSRIALPAIRLYANGNFEIVGGTIPLPTTYQLCLGPVKMSVTNLGFTSSQQDYQGQLRAYKCWGFDGALNVNPFGLDVRGNGVKYYYTVDNDPDNGKPAHSFIRISSIEVDLIIPGKASPESAIAIIKGAVSIPEPGVSSEYSGMVSLKLPRLNIAGSVEMKMAPKYPAYILDATVEIPTPIPLAATGLGVFGFRGLLGYRYVAEKEAVGLVSGEDSWYDYYIYPERGINLDKFRPPGETAEYKNPVSIGAGAAIATYGNDRIANFRVFLLLSVPSMFFIEGKANILAKQLGLDDTDEPPLFAGLFIGDDSIEAYLGADLQIPKKTGDLLDLQAKAEAAFFFKDPSAFYINIGTEQDPVTARILSMLTVQLYLQISAKGIAAGARAEFEFDKKYGLVRVRAYAYIELGGKISFERPQIGAYIALGGEALIDVKILSIYIGLDILLGAEAPRPFLLYGEFRLCVKVKIVFVKIKFCGQVQFKWEKSREVDRTPIPPISADRVLELVKGVHMLTGDAFDLIPLHSTITDPDFVPPSDDAGFSSTVLPLDTYIDIKFEKAVDPTPVSAKTGGINNAPIGNIELIPPQKTIRGKEMRQVKHAYSIQDVELKAWNGSNWMDYNPYTALAPGAVDSGVSVTDLKLGHWQKPGKEYNALRILGNSPFSFTQLGEPGWYTPERLGITASSLFCEASPLESETANWLSKNVGTFYLPNSIKFYETGKMGFMPKAPGFFENLGEEYKIKVVDHTNPFGFAKSLQVFNFMSAELRLPTPAKVVSLKLSTTGTGATISFYSSVINDSSLTIQYKPVEEVYKSSAELEQEVVYESLGEPITKVVVQPDFLDIERIEYLAEKLGSLSDEGYKSILNGEGGENGLQEVPDEAHTIQLEILDLLQTGCASSILAGKLIGGIGEMQIGNTFQVGLVELILATLEEYTSCNTLLHEVSWLSEVGYEFNNRIPSQAAIQEDFLLAEASVNKVIAPIWRPDTKYYMHLTLRDEVDNGNGGHSANYHYYYGFRTAGPVGHFHNASGVTYGLNPNTGETNRDASGKLIARERFPLASLSGYIDYNRSYPNADGNLLGSKPLFYAHEQAKLQLFFVRPQTYHMFNSWEAQNDFAEIESGMKVIIKDPVSDVLIPYPLPADFEDTTLPETEEAWEDDVDPLVPEWLQSWSNMASSTTACVLSGGEPVKPIKPKSKTRTVKLTNLKPQKLYTALVNNVHQGAVAQVHDYIFKTSRYANFAEQINSYLLDDGKGNTKEAIYKIPVSLPDTAIAATLNSIDSDLPADSTNQVLAPRYADRFDRVVEGIWGQAPLPVAMTTEFNAVVDQNTGYTIALWIRNPEPFNDPKTPAGDIKSSIEVLHTDSEDADLSYKVLHSKDYAQVLIMSDTKTITGTALRIRFRYLQWNGSSYEVMDSVTVAGLNLFQLENQ